MRILYDSNILVAILSRREAILDFKKDIAERKITIISSYHILREVEAVLSERLGLTRQKAKAAVRLLERQSIIVTPNMIERVCRDPFDDYILAAAVEGAAEYIVTEDKDLLTLKTHKNIEIIRLTEFKRISK